MNILSSYILSYSVLRRIAIICGFIATMVIISAGLNDKVSAQTSSCSNLASDLGLLTNNLQLDQSGTYDVWARVKAPDGNSQFTYSIDGSGGSSCNNTFSASGASDTWIWAKSSTRLNWTGGSVRIQISGTKAGVGLDCVVLTQDTGFLPTGTSGCEPPPDTISPSVQITAPVNNAALNLTVPLTATATDNVKVSVVTFYVNGNQIGQDTTSPYTINWNSLSVADGSYQITAIATDSSDNKTTSSSVAITVNNKPVAPKASDLQSRWQFNENSGTVANDSIGTTNGALIGSSTWASGVSGSAVNLSGSGAYVNLGNNLNLTPEGFSMSGWIRPDTHPADARIISKATSTAEQDHTFMISMNNPGNGNVLRFRLKTGSTTTTLVANTGVVPLNTWSHIAATYDGASMKLFLNGVEVGSTPKTGTIASNTVATWIGGNPNGSNYFDGLIDDLQLYKIALNSLEVAALAAGASPTQDTTPDDTTAPTILISSPSNGSTLSATVQVSATASDNVGISRVSFFLDGSTTPFGTDTSAPYTTVWNSADSPNGAHTITAVATDTSGNTTTSSAVTFNVQNSTPDTQSPTTSISTPTDGSIVSGNVIVQASASDDVGVSMVQLLLNGNLVASDTASPYSFNIDTTLLSEGNYEIRTRAYDAANNNSLSPIVRITVDNIPEPVLTCNDPLAINVGGPLPCTYDDPNPPVDPTPVPGDVDGDGDIDRTDLRIAKYYYKQTVPPYTNGDMDGDGYVDRNDLRVIQYYYGR